MTLLGLDFWDVILAVGVVAVGAAIQSAVGFGLAMIAAPLLLLIDRELVPGPLILTALCLVIWMSIRERQHITVSHFKAALAGRLIGSPIAALLMGVVSASTFDLIFGVMVLAAIGISLVHADIRATPKSVFVATIASGFMSTISSIGGPPLALVYQHARGAELRANLSAMFAMGCVVSLISLALVGRFGVAEFFYGMVLLVGVVIGERCSTPLKNLMDRGSARPYLLGLCAVSAIMVLARALLSGG